jgi:hypothetical protein
VVVDRIEDGVDPVLGGTVDLVDDADICHPQVGLTRVVAELVARPMGVDDHDVQVRADERGVVVAAVPEDDVGFLFGGSQDPLVVDSREDEVALGEMGLVLLPLFDRRVGRLEVLVPLEALDGLLGQVAVGHRVAED